METAFKWMTVIFMFSIAFSLLVILSRALQRESMEIIWKNPRMKNMSLIAHRAIISFTLGSLVLSVFVAAFYVIYADHPGVGMSLISPPLSLTTAGFAWFNPFNLGTHHSS